MKFLEKINDASLVGRAVKLEALSKKRDVIINKNEQHQNIIHDKDLSIELDPRNGYYRVISYHVPEKPSELNLSLDDILHVEAIYTDGYCYAYAFLNLFFDSN